MLRHVVFPFLVAIAILNACDVAQAQWIRQCQRAVSWSLPDNTSANKSCILMTGDYYLIVPYNKTGGAIGTAKVLIPSNSTISGSCGGSNAKEQSIILTWSGSENSETISTAKTNSNNVITFTFTKNSTTPDEEVNGFYCLQKVKAVLHANPVEFPEATEPSKAYNLEAADLGILSSPLNTSYTCSTLQEFPLGDEGILRVEHVQIEVFHSQPLGNDGLDFSPRDYCLPDALRMLITAIVLILLLVSTAGFVVYLCIRKPTAKTDYGRID